MKSKKKVFWLALMILVILSTGITVQAATRNMYIGQTYKLKVRGARKWVSKNKKIAQVKQNGTVIPKRAGKTFIKVYKKKGYQKIWINVKKPYINKKKITLNPGQTYKLKLNGTKVVLWKTSRKSVATVTKNGVVRAKKAGTVTITCRGRNKKTYKCTVNVKKKTVAPTPTPSPSPTPVPQVTSDPAYNGKRPVLISHRGYRKIAPENTLAAFRTAAEYGYKAVECDIHFTKDNVPVIIHNATTEQTSNGHGKIKLYTYEEARQLDFGSWKSPMYTGEKIPSFEEFLILCRQYGLHPYVELKNCYGMNRENIAKMYDIACSVNMEDEISWFSFVYAFMEMVRDVDPTADVGYITSSHISEAILQRMRNLQTPENTVTLYCYSSSISPELLEVCKRDKIEMVARAVSTDAVYQSLDSYYKGALTDSVLNKEISIIK